MNAISAEVAGAVSAVLRRLTQVNIHWHEALSEYFEPNRFRIAMQNCITSARSVTFILQNYKSVIPGFEEWYAPWQSRFRDDPVMRWAVQARNKIEKQGDLETVSQMRVELVAAYVGNPVTKWTTMPVRWSLDQIRRSIPAKLISQYVIENGVLSIERRWVDTELPETEVLDALAHVYGQLALLTVSLHDHISLPLTEHRAGLSEHILHNLLQDGRSPSMERPLEDRAIYITVKDGSLVSYRRDFKPRPSDAEYNRVQRRYGNLKLAKRLTTSSTLMEVAKVYFDIARTIMARDGHHLNVFIPLKGVRQIGQVVAEPQSRADKYMLMRDIARYVRRIDADGLLHVSEAWMAQPEDIPRRRYPDQARNRLEILMMDAVSANSQPLSFSATIQRKLIRKQKVKALGPTQIEEGGRVISMAPVLEVWGKLDVLRLHELSDWDEWLKDHYGHTHEGEPPT
jgi:hypothetical protein